MGKQYSEKMTIPFDLVDVKGQLKLPLFLAKILDVSGRQSAQLGRSDTYLLENYGLVWIVTDYDFLIHDLPSFNQEIIIRTEAVSYNKFICYRIFDIFDQEGQKMIELNAYFALMDISNRKIVGVPDDLVAPYGSQKVKKIERGIKYPELDQTASAKNYHIRYFDIDMNGHVNNSRYLDWIYEVMDFDFLKSHRPKRIHLRYSREVSPRGDITSLYQIRDLISYHQIASEGQLNAQARIEWVED